MQRWLSDQDRRYRVVSMRTGIPGILRGMSHCSHSQFHELLFLSEVVVGQLDVGKTFTHFK